MQQNEIDEISEAFSDAWEEYFGDRMKYVRFNREETVFHKTYNESKTRKYDYANAIEFNGSLKEIENEDVTQPYGDNEYKLFTITLVTKELLDKGVIYVNHDDIITYTQIFGDTKLERRFSIYDSVEKVQFNASKIFTKIMVKEVLENRRYSTIPKEEEDNKEETNG